MAKSNTLIGGDVPLQFFERAFWEGEPLELYHSEPDGQNFWKTYLEGSENYECWQKPNKSEKGKSEMRLTCSQSRRKCSILVIHTEEPPIQAILKAKKFTLLANILSWNKAYSLLPSMTFIHYKAHSGESAHSSRTTRSRRAIYEHQGWKICNSNATEESNHEVASKPVAVLRRVGDCYSWTVPFDTKGIEESSTRLDLVLEYATFNIAFPCHINTPEHRNTYNYTCIIKAYNAAVLKHTYTTGYDGWGSWLDQIMHYKVLEELHKLKSSDRPSNFDEVVSNPRPNYIRIDPSFEKPDSWHYCDDEIPVLFEQWKSAYCHPGR